MTNLWDKLPREDAGIDDESSQHIDGFKVTVYTAGFLLLCGFWYGVFRLVVWIGGLR